MKKFLSILIAVMLVVSMSVIAVSAQSYNPNGDCDVVFTAKKADPANVIKDGIIGEGEYEKLDINLSPDDSPCILVYGSNAAMYMNAEDLLSTMEYYFSWDDVHGFNLAVKCKPSEYSQTIPLPTGKDYPGDDFLCNLGIQVDFEQMLNVLSLDQGLFYYSLSKNAQTGEYMEGYYTQLGLKGAYDPTPGVDYAINFNADGSITYEWSIGFDNFMEDAPTDGSKVYFNVCVLAGTDTLDELHCNTYGVGLGDYVFLGDRRMTPEPQCATAVLSSAMIGAGGNGDTTVTGGDTTDVPGTDPIDTNNPETNVPETNENGDVVVPETNNGINDNGNTDINTNGNTQNNGTDAPSVNGNTNGSNRAPSTADPIVITAIVSAVSACSFAISKKRK